MGVGSVIGQGLGGLLHARQEPLTPSNGAVSPLQSLFARPREMPLPLTPFSVLRSLVQLQDLQALLWAWLLVGLLLLIAYCTSPSETSFKPFLTDFVFRERLRVLHNDSLSAIASAGSESNDSPSQDTPVTSTPSTNIGCLATTRYSSTSPFALAFKSKISLSVRTPPYHRKDLALFSVVTISHSMPLYRNDDSLHTSSPRHKAKSDGTSQHTSVFIGAFGKWWTFGYGIPDLPDTAHTQHKQERVELEDNREQVREWGVLDMQIVDPEVESPTIGSANQSDASDAGHGVLQPRVSPPASRPASPVKQQEAAEASPADGDDICLADLVAQSQAEIADLQEQLHHIKLVSSRTCEALETDLEDIRSKKRDEEKARSDIKARTKTLDDSKRHVESSRRDAERRLKAANTAISLKQNSIATKKETIESLYRRRAALTDKIQASSERREQRSEELRTQVSQTEEKMAELEQDISSLHRQISESQAALETERFNLNAAYELAHWRDTHKLDPQIPPWTSFEGQDQRGLSDPALAYLPYTQDPLVDTLSRMEKYGHRPDMYQTASNSSEPLASPEGFHEVGVPDKRSRGLGTSVLRNAFRRATAGVGSEPGASPTANANTGLSESTSLQSVSDFEAIKQAFQPTVASEEDGRRSWSAFDMWQSDIRGGAQHRVQWAEGAGNASADSLPRFVKAAEFSPLDRSTSAGADPKSVRDMTLTDAEHLRNTSKVKRAFRWPFRPTQVQEDLA